MEISDLGFVEWFRPGEAARVERVADELERLGIKRLRTGVSWADYHSEAGEAWYDWLLPRLARSFELLPCVVYTPPSLGLVAKTSSPPREPKAYADFLDKLVSRHGACFDWVELWNEPNNLNDWDWRLDHEWRLFSEMLGAAAYWMRARGKRTVLGGMCPTDPNWLELMIERGIMAHIDAVGVHGFPGTWNHDWQGWSEEVGIVRDLLARLGRAPEIWITEGGYASWRHDEARQLKELVALLEAPVARVYWYSYQDLHPELASQEGFHVDERHYHTGIVTADGRPKLAARALAKGRIGLLELERLTRPAPARPLEPAILITGGAGFLGANLADRLAAQRQRVLILDSLARPKVEDNLAWLKDRHKGWIEAEIADLRDVHAVREAVGRAAAVIHLAAQVAVTTSLEDPVADFESNARGTLNLLEAVRARPTPPPLLFASTNKVYGELIEEDALTLENGRYRPAAAKLAQGADETMPLELFSPYGCSKGVADQYVLDYARVFGLKTLVFRMSCIYGPRQFGTEDQGWLAHFLIKTLKGEPITIYGDGRQVRDVLFVEDAVEAYLLGLEHIDRLKGRPFNLGGGPGNATNLLELVAAIERLSGLRSHLRFEGWRPGDQRWYVSNTAAFKKATGWRPRTDLKRGLERLFAWFAPRLEAEMPADLRAKMLAEGVREEKRA